MKDSLPKTPLNPPPQPTRAPTGPDDFWPEAPQVYHHNCKASMSSLRSPKYFPEQLPPPDGLPLRLPPQLPKLAELDKIYDRSPHPFLSSQGNGCGGYNETQDESRSKDALKTLERHIKARTPYVELASSRLQAAVGVRNESPFDLPELPSRTLSPRVQALYNKPEEGFASSGTDKGGMKAKSVARGGKRDCGIGFIPKSPVGMQTVDRKTGKGLREFMLQKGKMCGMRKQECKSITFHDFTPDMRSGHHSNVLLGHYGIEKGERVDVYEVDLPAIQSNEAGEELPTAETWIWILISRPLVSYDPDDIATRVALESPNLASSGSDMFHTPYSKAISPVLTAVNPTPPNFPHPNPLSWLVFAAPKAHVTTYPESVENHDGSTPKHLFTTQSPTIYKRTDYDFAFSGIPLFEFSSADIFTPTSVRTEFLSIEQMGAWYENDPYTAYSEEEYRRMFSLWEDGEWGLSSGGSRKGCFDEEGRPTAPIPPPNRGTWWKIFYERMKKDVDRWNKIKSAMGRGKCRVVVRWVEALDDGIEKGNAGGGKHGAGKKGAHGKRLTRSETRRQSGLGVSDPPVGLAIGGVASLAALGENCKSKAAGNLGRAGGVGEKEKTKPRRRGT